MLFYVVLRICNNIGIWAKKISTLHLHASICILINNTKPLEYPENYCFDIFQQKLPFRYIKTLSFTKYLVLSILTRGLSINFYLNKIYCLLFFVSYNYPKERKKNCVENCKTECSKGDTFFIWLWFVYIILFLIFILNMFYIIFIFEKSISRFCFFLF